MAIPTFSLEDGTITLVCGFPTESLAVEAAGSLPAAWTPLVDIVEGADWLDAWREHFPVTRIGRFVLVPAWKDVTGDPVLEPGRHPDRGAIAELDLESGARRGHVPGPKPDRMKLARRPALQT